MAVVYISGKLTGLSGKERENNFANHERCFVGLGIRVYNPVKIIKEQTEIKGRKITYKKMYGLFDEYLKKADFLYLMPNYIENERCKKEKELAEKLGIPIMIGKAAE